MSVLVAYATHSGATRTLADAIVEELRVHGIAGEAIDVKDDPDPSVHDAVVLGSGVRMQAFERCASAWASKHRKQLRSQPFALFTCSGGAADPEKAKDLQIAHSFADGLQLDPVAVRNFPGWVLMDRIPMHERVLLTAMRVPQGDFRDLPAVASWTRGLLGEFDV